MIKLKKIIGYKVVIPKEQKKQFKKVNEVFGYSIDLLERIPYKIVDIDKYTENLERELNLLNDLNMLEVIKKPKIGDKCYFWNTGDKLIATTDDKPFISILEEVTDDGRYVAEDEDIVYFKWCQKAS